MWGAIAGIASNVIGGAMNGNGRSSGGGVNNILGGVSKLLDPLGLFGGGQTATQSQDSELKDLLKELIELIKELLAEGLDQGEGEESTEASSADASAANGAGSTININTGAGDDTVIIGPPPMMSTEQA